MKTLAEVKVLYLWVADYNPNRKVGAEKSQVVLDKLVV